MLKALKTSTKTETVDGFASLRQPPHAQTGPAAPLPRETPGIARFRRKAIDLRRRPERPKSFSRRPFSPKLLTAPNGTDFQAYDLMRLSGLRNPYLWRFALML